MAHGPEAVAGYSSAGSRRLAAVDTDMAEVAGCYSIPEAAGDSQLAGTAVEAGMVARQPRGRRPEMEAIAGIGAQMGMLAGGGSQAESQEQVSVLSSRRSPSSRCRRAGAVHAEMGMRMITVGYSTEMISLRV